MSKSQRLHFRASENQFADWEAAANREEREIYDWARRVLDIAAESGLTVVELRRKLMESKTET